MKEVCESQSEVRRSLGACAFYHIWIPHYAHIADPLYHLLRKGKKLKKTLRTAEALKKLSYDRPIIVTVDTSPTGIGWVINQADSDGNADMHKSKENYGESCQQSKQIEII